MGKTTRLPPVRNKKAPVPYIAGTGALYLFFKESITCSYLRSEA